MWIKELGEKYRKLMKRFYKQFTAKDNGQTNGLPKGIGLSVHCPGSERMNMAAID